MICRIFYHICRNMKMCTIMTLMCIRLKTMKMCTKYTKCVEVGSPGFVRPGICFHNGGYFLKFSLTVNSLTFPLYLTDLAHFPAFKGLENGEFKFPDFPCFPWCVRTLCIGLLSSIISFPKIMEVQQLIQGLSVTKYM